MHNEFLVIHIVTGRFWKTPSRAEARFYLTSPLNRAYYVVQDGTIIDPTLAIFI